jgi:hypothetical protein
MNANVGGNRFVVPQWLHFKASCDEPEANRFQYESCISTPESVALQETAHIFEQHPNPFIASELMGLAFVAGRRELAIKAAEYVAQHSAMVGNVAKNQAQQILGRSAVDQPSTPRTQIGKLKRRLSEFPLDALSWVERARMHAILGSQKHAKLAMHAALHLAPSDRFVVRSAVRLFIHCSDWSAAAKIAERAYSLNPDPLIAAPLLSVATYLRKLPRQTKSMLSAALAHQDRLLHSELLEAGGTLELLNGGDHKAKKLFRSAWQEPTRTVIAHSQWVLREGLPTLAEGGRLDFQRSREALSWLSFATLDFKAAADACTEWAFEEPYSRDPHVLGSLAACQAGDFLRAEQLAKAGLVANPRDHCLLNNLAFSQLHNGAVEKAAETFAPLIPLVSKSDQIAPTATFGMLRMAQGNVVDGDAYYALAIQRALDLRDRPLALRATLNYVLSRITFTKTIDISFVRTVTAALQQIQDPGCIGVAHAIARKLDHSDLKGSDELSMAVREFSEIEARVRRDYLETARRRFGI